MTHDRFAPSVGRDQLLEIAVAPGHALVLTRMFGPRDDDERLERGVGLFEIAIQTPSRRSIPAPDALVLPHRPEECVCVLGFDSVLDGDEHRPLFESGRDGERPASAGDARDRPLHSSRRRLRHIPPPTSVTSVPRYTWINERV